MTIMMIIIIIMLEGLACLHLAALNRQHQILTLLSKMGADLNIQVNPSHLSPISLVACMRSTVSHWTEPCGKPRCTVTQFARFCCLLLYCTSTLLSVS